jgi:hypothetical protein
MSLQVEPPAGIGQSAEHEVHSMWDTIDNVLVETMKEGFYPLDTPRYAMPILDPSVLTNFNPDQYAILYAQMEGWQSYTASKLAVIDGGLFQCENEMDDIDVAIRTQVRRDCETSGEKKPAEAAIKDMVKTNPRYRQLRLYHQQLKQTKNLLQSHFDRLGRGMRLLSRYIEVQKIEAGNTGRRGL